MRLQNRSFETFKRKRLQSREKRERYTIIEVERRFCCSDIHMDIFPVEIEHGFSQSVFGIYHAEFLGGCVTLQGNNT